MGREFELKFKAGDTAFAAVFAEFAPFEEISMETTYFDTPEGALAARHMTLRCRRENAACVCTVKAPIDDYARGEWDVQCEDIHAAIPMLLEKGAPEILGALTKSGIAPKCGAKFTRQAKTVTLPGCTVELALDKGVLLGGGRTENLQEIEVEFKSGMESHAVAFAMDLAGRHGLKKEKSSKFKRAKALAEQE